MTSAPLSRSTRAPSRPSPERGPEAALPRRWGPWQRRKNTLLYGLIRAGAALLAAVPTWAHAPLAALAGPLAAAVLGRERRRARQQLARALPHLGRRAVRRTVAAMFVHLARSALELGRLAALVEGRRAVRLPAAARAVLDAALAEGRGAVAVGGHLGNWELLSQVLCHAGYPLTAVAKPLYDPRLTAWMHRLRGTYGMRLAWRGAPQATREMLRALRGGRLLGLLIDQDTRVQGCFVPFFGRPAHTPTAAASLALRHRAPLLLLTHRRHRGRHHIAVQRLPLPPEGAHGEAVEALTAALSGRLEAAIRAAPEQWVWLHDRWRQQPAAAPEPAAAD